MQYVHFSFEGNTTLNAVRNDIRKKDFSVNKTNFLLYFALNIFWIKS